MYGYKVENGRIDIVEDEAAIVRCIFQNYLSGMSMRKAAVNAGANFTHSSVKKIIRQKRYVGNDFYPAIIDKDIFARQRRTAPQSIKARLWETAERATDFQKFCDGSTNGAVR